MMQSCASAAKLRGGGAHSKARWQDQVTGRVAATSVRHAMPPIATQSVRRNEASRCANNGPMHRDKPLSRMHPRALGDLVNKLFIFPQSQADDVHRFRAILLEGSPVRGVMPGREHVFDVE